MGHACDTSSESMFLLYFKSEVVHNILYAIRHKQKSLLPARASEQGNVIGLVSVYIYITEKPFTSK